MLTKGTAGSVLHDLIISSNYLKQLPYLEKIYILSLKKLKYLLNQEKIGNIVENVRINKKQFKLINKAVDDDSNNDNNDNDNEEDKKKEKNDNDNTIIENNNNNNNNSYNNSYNNNSYNNNNNNNKYENKIEKAKEITKPAIFKQFV